MSNFAYPSRISLCTSSHVLFHCVKIACRSVLRQVTDGLAVSVFPNLFDYMVVCKCII
jgi:hypothetical protein